MLSPGLSIHYLEHNPSGSRCVLLLHGLGASAESWIFQLPILTGAGFRVIVPDARGFGCSPYPGKTGIVLMARDMAELLQRLDITRTHVVGISMGGTIALQLAIDYPTLVERLVLVNAFIRLRLANPGTWLYYAFRYFILLTMGHQTQARVVAKRIFPHPGQAELRQALISQITQADPAGYRATMRSLVRFNGLAQVAQIRSPTLVITGSADTTVPPQLQVELCDRIPGARQAIIEGAGHAVIAECPDQFNRVLLDFLRHPD